MRSKIIKDTKEFLNHAEQIYNSFIENIDNTTKEELLGMLSFSFSIIDFLGVTQQDLGDLFMDIIGITEIENLQKKGKECDCEDCGCNKNDKPNSR